MMSNHFLKAGAAAVTLAVLTAGATAVHSNSSTVAVVKEAEASAGNATRALAKGKADAAVRFAENAVQLRPQDATYRSLLGKAYLAAGRFFSAKQAFADALQLDSGLPGVALNLALATTATGDFAAAQEILKTNAGAISPADRGLALALAGNPGGAIDILLPVARGPESDAKIRQNLALAFALAGRWPEARQVASTDLSPGDLDARIMQWASFARPAAASDQVSAMLGVTPVADAGLPVQLALVSGPAQFATAVPAEPEASAAPIEVAAVSTPEPAAVVAPTEVAEVAPRPMVGQVVFAEPREMVQALPASPVRTVAAAPVATAAVVRGPSAPARSFAAPAKGNFYVQLGAYDSADMARWGWSRASKRYGLLSSLAPSTMPVGNGLVRLAVGGFARGDADRVCRSVRASGGACFVRVNAGDRLANWTSGRLNRVAVR